MKAIVIREFGGPDHLQLAEVPTPQPGPDEVLIEIAYTSVNPVDWKIREGMLQTMFPHRFPLILGWDAAGTIAAVGDNVRRSGIGDRVFAYCRKPLVQWGTYAEYVTLNHAVVASMPDTLSFAEAATIPLVGLTSWQSLYDAANLVAGQTVLVLNGAGGTGTLAIQFAKHSGATVLAVGSSASRDYLKSLGSDAVIDYRREDVAKAVAQYAPDGVDVVYANIAGDPHRNSYRLLKRGGVLVTIVDPPDIAAAEAAGARADFVFVEPNGAQLGEIGRLIESGFVRPPALTVMNVKQAAEAQSLSEAGHVRGKIALEVRF